jgi:threonine synthase
MQGLADDGGLFMPDHWPKADIDEIKSKSSFVEIAKCIVPLFTASSFSYDETISIVESTWHDFEHQDLINIKEFDSVSILELFHGPTAAFKDFGLQLAAAFFNKVLESENKTAIVLGATSGDTGPSSNRCMQKLQQNQELYYAAKWKYVRCAKKTDEHYSGF